MAAQPFSAQVPPACVLERPAHVDLAHRDGRCPEDLEFPNSMRACMEFLGESWGSRKFRAHERDWGLDRAMVFASGVSGEPFVFDWRFTIGAADLQLNPGDAIRRTLAATGYSAELVFAESFARAVRVPDGELGGGRYADPDEARALLVAHLAGARRPALALGLREPPAGAVVVGYEDSGRALVWWNYVGRGPAPGPDGYYRASDWLAGKVYGLVLIGAKQARSAADYQAARQTALARGVELLGRAAAGGGPAGFAMYADWARAIETPDAFPPGDVAALRRAFGNRIEPMQWDLAERRWYAANLIDQFVENAPEPLPAAASAALAAAHAAFMAEHDLMYELRGSFGGGHFEPLTEERLLKLGDPGFRARLAECVRRACVQDRTAAAKIAEALAVLAGPPAAAPAPGRGKRS